MQAYQGGAEQPALERHAGRECFGHDALGRRIFHAVNAMFLRVKFFVSGGIEQRHANAAGGIATGILKAADLLGEFGLAGTQCGGVQGVDVIQDAGDNLQPFAFRAAEFFNFEAERAFLGVIEFDLEFIELLDLGAHALGNFGGGGNGFIRVALGGFLHARPLVGGGGNLPSKMERTNSRPDIDAMTLVGDTPYSTLAADEASMGKNPVLHVKYHTIE